MLKDPRAKRAWQIYFLRAEAVLGAVSGDVRRELIDDLKRHVADILAEDGAGDELARVNAALARVGDPKEFLAPLLSDAVFRAPPQQGSLGMAWRTVGLYAGRGASYFVRASGLIFAAAAGVALALSAFNSLLRPEQAGLFFFGGDVYQLRMLGFVSRGGEQLLEPWMALLLIAVGIAIVWWSFRRTRKMLLELIATA